MTRTFTIIVCPNCEKHELEPGSYRCECPGCGTYFSRNDERPPDRDSYPNHWKKRLKWRYPTPGTRLRVTPLVEPVNPWWGLMPARPAAAPSSQPDAAPN